MTDITETNPEFIARRLRLAGSLIVAGLLVEGVSLWWNHPLSFVAFLGLGGLLMVVGMLVYLAALVSPPKN
jgi:hypothetical protein